MFRCMQLFARNIEGERVSYGAGKIIKGSGDDALTVEQFIEIGTGDGGAQEHVRAERADGARRARVVDLDHLIAGVGLRPLEHLGWGEGVVGAVAPVQRAAVGVIGVDRQREAVEVAGVGGGDLVTRTRR